MDSLINLVKKLDLFGMPIQFSFNKQGSEHRTFLGGLISLFIRAAILSYTVLLIARMVGRNDNKNETYFEQNQGLENVRYADAEFIITMQLLNISGVGISPIEYNEEVKRYINIYA